MSSKIFYGKDGGVYVEKENGEVSEICTMGNMCAEVEEQRRKSSERRKEKND